MSRVTQAVLVLAVVCCMLVEASPKIKIVHKKRGFAVHRLAAEKILQKGFGHDRPLAVRLTSNATISASPSVLERSGDSVTVTWSGVSNPHTDDYIAAFLPNRNGTTSIPIRYKKAELSKDYLTTGSGSLEFNLVNHREEYTFVILKNISAPSIVAISTPIRFKLGEKEPTGPHISLTQNKDEMRVVWTSANVTTPTVKFGKQPGAYDSSAIATSTTYTREHMCGGRAKTYGWRDPGIFHTAIMNNLTPSTKYYYIVGDATSNIWSAEQVLYTPHDATSTTHVTVWGDMGHANADGSTEVDQQLGARDVTRAIANEVSQGNVDLALHIGDISYARGYSHLWDEYMHDITPVSSRVAYMLSIGNHEMDYPGSSSYFQGEDSYGECGVPYDVRFPMIRPEVKFPDRLWYSFDLGYAHYVILSTEHNFTIGSAQHEWLTNDLKLVDQIKTPWVIVAGHRPAYLASTGKDNEKVAEEMRKNLESLFYEHRVALAFWGHHHSYQRTCAVLHEKCTKGAPVHIIVGTGGMHLSTNCIKLPHFEYVDCSNYGYGRMKITKTDLTWEFVLPDGTVKDKLQLTK